MIDLAIKNCKIVEPHGVYSGALGIERGKIVAVTSDAKLPKADKCIDAKSNFVIPGVIDPHQHWASGTGNFESDVRTETRAAAYGGVTTVITTINPRFLGGEYLEVFDEVRKRIDNNATVSVALTITVLEDRHIDEIPEYANRLGITSYKCHLGYKGQQADKLRVAGTDDGTIYNGYRQVNKVGEPAMIMVHCENVEIITKLQSEIMKQGRTDLPAYTETRPAFCEAEAMKRVIYLAGVAGARLYIPHITIGEGADIVAEAKAQGISVMAETCPHYLTLTKDCSKGPLAVVNPPLRDADDVSRLWRAIDKGVIDCIGTDHVVRYKSVKQTIWENVPGFPGVQTLLPIMLSEGVNRGRISLERLVSICSTNTAKIFGMYPRKGTISVGSDADLVIVDLKKEVTFTWDDIASSGGASDFSLYEGWKFKGVPTLAMVKGKVVMEDRQIVGKAGDGEYLPRFPSQVKSASTCST